MMRRLRSVLFVVIAAALIISSLSACSYKAEPNDAVKDASGFRMLAGGRRRDNSEKVKPAPTATLIYLQMGNLFRHNAGLQ